MELQFHRRNGEREGAAEPGDKATNGAAARISGSKGGRRRTIRLAAPDTVPDQTLAAWRADPRLLPLFWTPMPPDATLRSIKEDYWERCAQFVVFAVAHPGYREPVGLVFATPPASPLHRGLDVGVFIDVVHRGKGYGVRAVMLFCEFLFRSYDVVKLTFEIGGWDRTAVEILQRVEAAELEGTRLEHVFWNSEPYDLFEFGLARERFGEFARSALGKRIIGDSHCEHRGCRAEAVSPTR